MQNWSKNPLVLDDSDLKRILNTKNFQISLSNLLIATNCAGEMIPVAHCGNTTSEKMEYQLFQNCWLSYKISYILLVFAH